jgi:hypothetical protein
MDTIAVVIMHTLFDYRRRLRRRNVVSAQLVSIILSSSYKLRQRYDTPSSSVQRHGQRKERDERLGEWPSFVSKGDDVRSLCSSLQVLFTLPQTVATIFAHTLPFHLLRIADMLGLFTSKILNNDNLVLASVHTDQECRADCPQHLFRVPP